MARRAQQEASGPSKGRAGAGYAKPTGAGWIKRFRSWLSSAWDAVPVPGGQFLIWLSGARRQILAECPSERPRYTGLGAAILISAVMAGISLAFVLVTALNAALWVALPAAFAWGVAILSLNRLFVVSLPRGHGARFQLFRALPRLLIALLMGFVISTPIVLQIFGSEIQHQITVLHEQAAVEYYDRASTSPLAKQVLADQVEVNEKLAALGQAHSGQQEAVLRQEAAAAAQELQTDQAALQQQTRAFTAANQDNTGLLIRLQALDAITTNNAALATAWWLLVALLVVIDCTPILIKMLLNLGPESIYDRMLAAEEETQLRVAEHNRAVRLDAQVRAAEAAAAEEQMVLEGWQADIPDAVQDIIAARRRVEAERLRRWERDQMRRRDIPSDDDDSPTPVESSARRNSLRFWRRTGELVVGVVAALAFLSGGLPAIAIAVVVGVLSMSALVILQSADRTDRAARLLRALRSENPSIAGSRGRDQRTRPEPLAKAGRSAPASTMALGSSKTGPSSGGREPGATAKFCRSCGSLIDPQDAFCASCGRPTDWLSQTK